jgi:hypothetical protein
MALRLNWAEKLVFNELRAWRNPVRPTAERLLEAEVKCSQALADANAASEAGDKAKAEKLYERSQRWLDKYNAIKERT